MLKADLKGKVPKFHLRLKVVAKMLQIEVEDNGVGMDAETRKHIFEPFFTTKSVGQGTGLGLFISYYVVVEKHSGTLTVESTPGAGTCFTIQLPLINAQAKG